MVVVKTIKLAIYFYFSDFLFLLALPQFSFFLNKIKPKILIKMSLLKIDLNWNGVFIHYPTSITVLSRDTHQKLTSRPICARGLIIGKASSRNRTQDAGTNLSNTLRKLHYTNFKMNSTSVKAFRMPPQGIPVQVKLHSDRFITTDHEPI